MKKIVSTLYATCGLALAAMPLVMFAEAAHAQEAAPVRIATAGLDLRQPADAATFRRRVDAAADSLCRANGPTELRALASCRRAVRDEASAQMNATSSRGPAPAIRVASR